MSPFKQIKGKLIGFFALAGLLVSFSAIISTRTFAEEVRPLEAFCTEVDKKGDLCAIDEIDKGKGDEGLLAEDGIVRRVFDVMIWLTALLCGVFITVGAFKLTTSGGNKDSVKSGKNMIVYAAVGLAVILLSNLILNVIISFASSAG